MKNILKKWIYISLSICFLNSIVEASEIYLFLGGDSAASQRQYWDRPEIKGVQIIYSWKRLEPQFDQYNIALIQNDLDLLQEAGKGLFIQIQDKSFSLDRINIPNYLLSPEYEGGVVKQGDQAGEGESGYGWVAKQWVPSLRERFQKLLAVMAKTLDAHIVGINLSETAIDISESDLTQKFCDNYFSALVENILFLRGVFKQSIVLQYINFFPCEWNNDQKYMERFFNLAKEHDFGLGNPDTVPYRRGQMRNAYPFFNQYKKELKLIGIAVQEPDYTYINPQTKKKFTVSELYSFAQDYLGAHIIFWNKQEPQFSQKLIPFLQSINQAN